jgi:SpoVK/Ycf46/Vps4 family AAA+-type ATPase
VADGDRHPALYQRRVNDSSLALAREWKRLGRAATFVAVLTSPVLFVLLYRELEWSFVGALLGTIFGVAVFRGLIDVLAHRFIPAPTLYGAEDELKDEDVVSRRRLWYWRKKFRNTWRLFVSLAVLVGIAMIYNSFAGGDSSISGGFATIGDLFKAFGPIFLGYLPIIFILFFANFLILFGPLLLLGAGQIKGYEPGDADWGVKLADVRGQAEAKEEITRVVSLWQSGEAFEKAGGKRERGVLFLGAPGTGKTMLSKGIATSFNCPFVSIPGSGFAQTFIGMDAVLVRFLAMKAKRLARKWGGQCIVFIDEIDAVGMRRQALGSGFQPYDTTTIHDMMFFGPDGALTSDGDLVLETAAWRERLFQMRAEPRGPVYPPVIDKLAGAIRNFMIPGMMGGGGGLALNQLLVVMDGIDDPPLMKRVRTKRINTFLDALYVVPRKLGRFSLRLPPPKPNKEEIYFIGACNVALERLDPALTRPGRMGRHIYFRTPTWEDRRDIFDLYLSKVAHDPELDKPERRDELARITNGYSPAMIDQVCSMALTYAHSAGREHFERDDLVEAMTTVEAGVAIGQPYPKHEERATAIHEAGHAVCGHLFMENRMSTRLSIRKRGSSGGHHQAMEIEDRFGHWRSEEVGDLIWGLGAMAAEHVFYGQNTTGVGGDVGMVTARAAHMVGFHAMAPAPIDLGDRIADRERREEEEERVMERFEKIGLQIMHRSGGGMMDGNPYSATLGDGAKRKLVAGLLGQAFVVAYTTVKANRDGTDYIASKLMSVGELYGDDVMRLLEDARLEKPEIDVLDEDTWPVI